MIDPICNSPLQDIHSKKIVKPTSSTKEEMCEALKLRRITFGIYPSESGRDTSRLEQFRPQIESVGLSAIIEIAQEMLISDMDVGVFDKPERTIPELGIGGGAYKEGTYVEIDLDPDSPYRETAMKEELRRTLRHEFHHKMRYKSIGAGETLLERLVEEGLASWYEIQGSDDTPPIYATALTIEQNEGMLARARMEFDTVFKDNPDAWYFGSEEKAIPRWTLYTLGYQIVGEYLKSHPDKKVSDLYYVPAEDFRIKTFFFSIICTGYWTKLELISNLKNKKLPNEFFIK